MKPHLTGNILCKCNHNSCYRFDIVQRFLDHSLNEKMHVKAKGDKTLLQFYIDENNNGQVRFGETDDVML